MGALPRAWARCCNGKGGPRVRLGPGGSTGKRCGTETHAEGCRWQRTTCWDYGERAPTPDCAHQANHLDGTTSATALEWGGPLPPEVRAGCPWDLVLLSDLVYEREHLPALLDTLTALLEAQPAGGGGGGGAAGGIGAGSGASGSSAPCNGGGPATAVAAVAAAPVRGASPMALVAVELRTDTIIAQFVRSLVQRRLLVERVRGSRGRGGRLSCGGGGV